MGACLRPSATEDPPEATLCWRPALHSRTPTGLPTPHREALAILGHTFCVCDTERQAQERYLRALQGRPLRTTSSSICHTSTLEHYRLLTWHNLEGTWSYAEGQGVVVSDSAADSALARQRQLGPSRVLTFKLGQRWASWSVVFCQNTENLATLTSFCEMLAASCTANRTCDLESRLRPGQPGPEAAEGTNRPTQAGVRRSSLQVRRTPCDDSARLPHSCRRLGKDRLGQLSNGWVDFSFGPLSSSVQLAMTEA